MTARAEGTPVGVGGFAGPKALGDDGPGTADRIYASVSYALGAGVYVETLSTNNEAEAGAINLSGNELANGLRGNADANVLDGKAGADTMTGAAATQADDRIIYNSATGALLFDADGSGAGAAVQFATLAGGLALTSADSLVV